MIYDQTECWLGEGAFWHPERKQFFWFDIVNGLLHRQEDGKTRSINLGEMASAAGWIDADHLIVATESRLLKLNIATEAREDIIALEADQKDLRCNDGRADPWGGFWIGTMARDNERIAVGTFYRYYKGELRALYPGLTVPNACCFPPGQNIAVFVDTPTGQIKKVALDPETGWPIAEPETWLDVSDQPWWADGAVMDADGNFWVARWDGWGVSAYRADGTLLHDIPVNAAHCSCPAFGGPDLTTLFVTTAGGRVSDEDRARSSDHGKVHMIENAGKGLPEPRVIL